MAKTVFGMPGVGDAKPKGGDAIAPGGSPAAKGGGSLPQKSGKQSPASKEGANKPETKPAEKKPQVAKPVQAPMAKPAGSAAAPKAKPGGAKGKTMFGMPAMKLPGQPDPAPSTGNDPGEKIAAPAQAEPSSPPGAEPEGDAYKATVLGMAAADPNAQATDAEAPPEEIEEAPRETAAVTPATSNEGAGGTAPMSTLGGFSMGEGVTPKTPGYTYTGGDAGGSKLKWIIVAAIIVVVLLVLVLILMSGSSDSGAEQMPASEVEPPAMPSVPTPNQPSAKPESSSP